MFFEIFTVFIPCWLVMKQKREARKTLEMNARWTTESSSSPEGSVLGSSQSNTLAPSSSSGSSVEKKSTEERYSQAYRSETPGLVDDRLMCMGALEEVLRTDPKPLQEFSALRDFSGENIGFLTEVAVWKASWPARPDEQRLRDSFNRALGIYVEYISVRDAEFPINLSSTHLRHLDSIFDEPARTLPGRREINQVTPFDFDDDMPASSGADREVDYRGEIPAEFRYDVFDISESHIKYLVLTNTWPKYVKEVRRRSAVSEWTNESGDSQLTMVSRISGLLQRVF